ncbi:MAG: hypothetical protein LBT64_01670 [Puniceicoccales bacterium]|jgi:hypothetical protein|nr:hypothetical protein [Puniceicoccales bacterium]
MNVHNVSGKDKYAAPHEVVALSKSSVVFNVKGSFVLINPMDCGPGIQRVEFPPGTLAIDGKKISFRALGGDVVYGCTSKTGETVDEYYTSLSGICSGNKFFSIMSSEDRHLLDSNFGQVPLVGMRHLSDREAYMRIWPM